MHRVQFTILVQFHRIYEILVEFSRPSYPVLHFLIKITLSKAAGWVDAAQPSAGFGVVAVLKPSFSYASFCARTTLCGFRRGRGAKTVVFAFFRVRVNPLRVSALARCQNRRVFAFFDIQS